VPPQLRRIERKGKPGQPGVLFEASPVTLVGEGFTLKYPQRREQSPTAQQAGLARRESYLLDRNDPVVMENLPMNHLDLVPDSALIPAIVTQATLRQRPPAQ